MTDHKHTFTKNHEAAAAHWLARRDRGLTEPEQEAFMEWLAADPEHARAIQYLEQVWGICDRLEEWRPEHSTQPNPDLLAPKQARSRIWVAAVSATAIAAVLFLAFFLPARLSNLEGPGSSSGIADSSHQEHTQVITGANGNHRLKDGSLIEMRGNTILEVNFSKAQRHVHLVRGEAYFTVAHDASRPFVVEAAGVTVQALGTVFKVGLDQFDVSVEVTEGSVEVREGVHSKETDADAERGIVLAAGERAVLRYARLIPFDELPAYREKMKQQG